MRLVKGKWWPFQPRSAAMAPMGNIYFHPDGGGWSDDFSKEPLGRQGFFIHEMTHVWQAQTRGRFYLPLMRHPFCRYAYELKPGSRSSATASSSRRRSSAIAFSRIAALPSAVVLHASFFRSLQLTRLSSICNSGATGTSRKWLGHASSSCNGCFGILSAGRQRNATGGFSCALRQPCSSAHLYSQFASRRCSDATRKQRAGGKSAAEPHMPQQA